MFATVPTASGFVAMLATGFQERRGAGKLASTASNWLSNASGMEGFAGFNLCSLVVAVIGAAPLLVVYHAVYRRAREAGGIKKSCLFTSGESIMKQMSKYLSAVFLAATLGSVVVGCASTSTSEGTGQYLDDSVITGKVKAALVEDPTTKATEINVETFKGVVQLSGFVSSQAAANRAIELARGVSGVKGVTNDMRLK